MSTLTIPVGTDRTIGISVIEDGQPKDLTDADAVFVMWNKTDIIEKTLGNGLGINDGKIIVTLNREDIRKVPSTWSYEAALVDSAGNKDVITTGAINLVASKTMNWPEQPI